MTDHGKSDVSKLVSVEEGYRLAAMHRPGMAIVMGAECAAERKVAPLSFIEMRKLPGPRPVAADEIGQRLGMRDVHAALAGHQELAPDRGHGVVEVDGEAGVGERLGGHQAGRPAADDDGAG